MGDIREPNGVVLGESSSGTSCVSSLGQEAREVLARAEAETWEIIRMVHPTVVSEKRRRDVVDYVQMLLKGCLGCEVLPFGSVPLKTYLPDGDIDLTAFCGLNAEEPFASQVYSVLVAQDGNPAAKFVVKDVQYIRAEVKLVKCLVQNIVVDISFNQIGGLCALGFLEEIDRLIGKDHLFKRSIILIKAWCYYESRLLGAHHGLISTYALETLVLYIFHLFHTSLDGPLAVLHKFLDYFSKFDWENLCVSLSGPVHVPLLPEIMAERPETCDHELLLSDDFMKECVRKFSVPRRGADTNYRSFMQKHLNIVDPLKENNNLGRSISKGNFFRIRSAFSYGARKLGQILLPSQENVAEEVRKFFANTLNRHGNGQRPDVQDHLQLHSCSGFSSKMFFPFDEPYQNHINGHAEDSVYCNKQSSGCRVSFENTNHVIVTNFREAGTNIEEREKSFKDLSGDANELAASGIRDLTITELGDELCSSVLGDETENGHLDEDQHKDSGLTVSNGFHSWEEGCSRLCNGNGHLEATDSWQDSRSEYWTNRSGEMGRHEIGNLLPDLSGDADCHLDNLLYGRWLYDQGLAMPTQYMYAPQPPMFQPNVNGVMPRPALFLPPSFVEEMPKQRGLGTYFPVALQDHFAYRDHSTPRIRYQGQLKSPRTNGRGPMLFERNLQAQGPVHQGIGRPNCPDYLGSSPRGKLHKGTNGFVQSPEEAFEHDPSQIPSPEAETCRPPDSDPSPGSQNIEPICVDESRPSLRSYQLKDDEDFPPLST